MLRDFFGELVRHVKARRARIRLGSPKLKADPKALRPHFDAAFERYEREAWRWIDPEDPEIRLRAGFLRFLCLGGDDAAPVHERRLEVHGAYVDEDLDLSGCTVPQPLAVSRLLFRRADPAGGCHRQIAGFPEEPGGVHRRRVRADPWRRFVQGRLPLLQGSFASPRGHRRAIILRRRHIPFRERPGNRLQRRSHNRRREPQRRLPC